MKRCSIAFSLLILILAIASNSCKKDDIDNSVKVDEITFNPSLTYGEVVDIDGNKYKTVVIGSKEWMAENLKSAHYNDGSPIPYIKGASEWEDAKVDAYSIFNNNSDAYKNVYGALYNFFTIADERNVCPIGWHVPSYKELIEFIAEIGGDYGSDLKLKEAGSLHWEGLNYSKNSTGFTAIPAGARESNGTFGGNGVESDWWTSTEANVAQGIAYFFANPTDAIQLGIGSKNIGASVRCVKDNAVLKTSIVSDIEQNSATCGGRIDSKDAIKIIERGVCWSTKPNPTIIDNKTSDGQGVGVYTSSLKGLNMATTYYVRAYANIGAEVLYGDELIFNTLSEGMATINTLSLGNLTKNSVESGGCIVKDGGSSITSRGVCWSNSPNPTINLDTKTVDGSGSGSFISKVTGLAENTKYYLRSYATNIKTTTYGNEIQFVINDSWNPSVLTSPLKNINAVGVTCGGTVIGDGGLTVTERGVCWSTSPNPTIDQGNKTVDGTDIGSFTSTISGLSENTVFYIRAYATNSFGTNYGNELNFKTAIGSLPVISNSIDMVNVNSAHYNVYISSDGNAPITERGICWSTSANPTIEQGYKVTNGTGKGNFDGYIYGLLEDTKYYVKGYAINSMGIGYGSEVSFTTSKMTVPILTNIYSENIGYKSAEINVYVSSNGNSPMTERGICWNTSPNPSIDNGNKMIGETTSSWSKYNVSGLEPNATYYVRGYAKNSIGVGYSNEISFKTLAFTVPKLTTLNASFVTPNSLTIGGSITNDEGTAISDRGICWSTSPSPTIELNDKISLGTGTGSFTINITGLTENTKYYFRSYATNGLGTGYGNEVAQLIYFGTVSDVDGNVYNTLAIGTQVWMKENLKTTKYNNGDPIPNIVSNDEWKTQKNGAYCWYNNDINNKDIYGALYNAYTVIDSRKLCPIGWHVPTKTEWSILVTYLGGANIAGGKMKATTLWYSPNYMADNSSGFTAFPGGMRSYLEDNFSGIATTSYWWASTGYFSPTAAPYWLHLNKLFYNTSFIDENLSENSEAGHSVRCLKDQ